MKRARYAIFFILLSTPLISFAQQPDTLAATGDVLTTPEQLRRMAPPEETLTATELEVRADSLRSQKAYADALDYYRAAIRKKETSSLHNKAGISQMQMLRYDDSKKSFERALKLDKRNAEARNNLGVIYYIKQNFGRAVKEYRKAIQIKEDSASFYSNLGTAFFARKEYQKASDAYMKAITIDSEIFESRGSSGIQMHMTSPEDRARYHYTIAKMFATRGDAEKCLLYLRKAIEEGFPEIGKVYEDSEFSGVRKDPRFTALMERKPLLPN